MKITPSQITSIPVAFMITVFSISASAATRVSTNEDYDAVASSAVSLVEFRQGKFIYVLPESADPEARVALAKIRQVVEPKDVPVSDAYLLPGGYFRIKTFRVSESTALFEGTIGPVPANHNLACGVFHTLPFLHTEGKWVVGQPMISMC